MRVSLKGILVASYSQSNIVLNNIVLRLYNPNFYYVSFKLVTFISKDILPYFISFLWDLTFLKSTKMEMTPI